MRSNVAALALALAAAGCGNGLAAPDYATPFGTIHGALSIPPGWHTGNLRIALLWLGNPNAAGAQVAQAVSVEPDSLTTFRLDVTALPPPDAVWSGDPSFAQGAIVAYDDVNGNGRLDIAATPDASPDRVIGKSYDTRVFFLTGGSPIPVSTGFAPPARGLSLVRFVQRDPAPGSCATPAGDGFRALPCMFTLDDPTPVAGDITVEVRDDPHLQGYACNDFWGSEAWPDWFSDWFAHSPLAPALCTGAGCDCTGVGCALDLPKPGVPVTCSADGTAYTYTTCVDDPSLCGTRFCHYGHGERRAAEPPPPGWPCP